MSATVEVLNVNHPGKVERLNAAMYEAMKTAYLQILPDKAPGLTPAVILGRLPDQLPQDLYPQGAKAGWWAKAVQLDLEARGVIAREKGAPVRLFKL